MAPLSGDTFVRYLGYPLSLIGTSSSSYSRLQSSSGRSGHVDHDEDIPETRDDGPIAVDPPLFYVSPFQFWAGRLVARVNKSDGVLDDKWLPVFSRGSAALRQKLARLLKSRYGSGSGSGRGLWSFVVQFEIGGMVALGFMLELLSSILSLLAPWILHRLLTSPRSVPLAVSLVVATILATLLGRARDQVCRTHAVWTECMLRSTIFAKALRLSAAARVRHPPAKIINLSAVDVDFLSNYVMRLHDIWSAPLQILAIGFLAVGIMGWPALAGFATMAALFVVQGRAGIWMRGGIRGYISLNDARLAALRDLLGNFKAVKALAVEPVYRQLISEARTGQLKALRRYLTAGFSIFTAINQTIPGVVACTAFLAYWAAGNELSAQVVFPSLAYFNLLSQPVFQASLALSRQFSVKPSLTRISELLYAEELEGVDVSPEVPDAFARPGQVPAAVQFHNAIMAYPSDISARRSGRDGEDEDTNESESGTKEKATEERHFLRDMDSVSSSSSSVHDGFGVRIGDLRIPKGRLTTVIGPTGSGKTSLLLSILGELSPVSGHHTIHGRVSYAAQEPLILSGTFKDNITLERNSALDHSRYRNVIRRTGLDIDLAGCPGGAENAVIGESGGNLSGGQRARVGLARALYADAEILLLDDPLAAVDARVRNKLFDAFKEEMRTVVLATLHTQYVLRADYVVVLDENKVVWSGDQAAFMADQNLCSQYLMSSEETAAAGRSDAICDDKVSSSSSPTSDVANNTSEEASHEEAVCLVEDEERAKGALKWKVLSFYSTAAGGTFQALGVLGMATLLMGARVMGQYWFVWWIDDSAGLSQSTYMGVYLALVVAQSALIAALGLVLVSGSIRAGRCIHDTIVENMLAAPLTHFQSQPTGRILNRLSADIESLDTKIMNAVDGLVAAGTTLLSSLVLIAATGSFMFATVVPFLVIVGYYLQRFRVCAREIQRTVSLLSSPVLSILSESLSAPATIHAYASTAIPFLQERHAEALNTLTSARLVRRSLDTWVTLRAEGAAGMVLALVAALTAFGVIPEIQAGLALGVATTLAKNVYLLAWSATDLEIQMNSAERLMVYHDDMPREGPRAGGERRTPAGWPSNNKLVLRDVFVQYKSRAEPVLKGINLEISTGQRVGIVGRTGSGKSTLLSALACLVMPVSGSISLSGVDISSIVPRKLRGVIHTLPQEPLIFNGTLRRNLDPHGKHPDSDLLYVLEVCQLRGFLESRFEVLDEGNGESSVGDEERVLLDQRLSAGGTELSMGQRQLLCAARVLLAKPKVLLVDEAAANIDFASDAILQRALRELLPQSTTMVVIAHRAASLAWMDRIVALQSGRVVEDDSPLNLLEGSLRSRGGKRSYYASMVKEDGDEALGAAIRVARDRFTGEKQLYN
ncbi:spermidine/putrescine import ATP-binding protein potA [Apodospora peruviana]|uniref:Spermidine/putrescine import ATP-binding protein potA n=1 Tax=Apodospora peruviana TaxID=516989 RepID=A0AAE0IB63_9PEZI|nr:spermidine/putrescine import ATP-binding protein potA [Apodospora peruviana]